MVEEPAGIVSTTFDLGVTRKLPWIAELSSYPTKSDSL